MNETLAAIYGTGFEKAASEEELDLTQISAADYLAALEGLEEEKVAGGLDLSHLSDEELAGLHQDLSGDAIEKMAASGEFEYWDAAGRIMAHAHADEAEKLASNHLDVSNMTVEDFLFLSDGLEKEASYEPSIDLNELSVEEIIYLGQELEKEAGLGGEFHGKKGYNPSINRPTPRGSINLPPREGGHGKGGPSYTHQPLMRKGTSPVAKGKLGKILIGTGISLGLGGLLANVLKRKSIPPQTSVQRAAGMLRSAAKGAGLGSAAAKLSDKQLVSLGAAAGGTGALAGAFGASQLMR